MEQKLPRITSAFLNVTNACNLACRYCFVEQHPNYMTLDVAMDAAKFLVENAKETGDTPGITLTQKCCELASCQFTAL